MIGPGTGVRVYLACGVTDMRKGIAGAGRFGAGCVASETSQWCGICGPWAARGSDQASVLGWPGVFVSTTKSWSVAASPGRMLRMGRCG